MAQGCLVLFPARVQQSNNLPLSHFLVWHISLSRNLEFSVCSLVTTETTTWYFNSLPRFSKNFGSPSLCPAVLTQLSTICGQSVYFYSNPKPSVYVWERFFGTSFLFPTCFLCAACVHNNVIRPLPTKVSLMAKIMLGIFSCGHCIGGFWTRQPGALEIFY